MNWEIIEKEITIRTSRSGGAGGQHVNKVETKVELVFIPADSVGLEEKEKQWLQSRIGDRYTQDGALLVSSQASRSQHRNRELALEKMRELLEQNVRPPRPRPKRRKWKANPARRRDAKQRRSEKKKWRRPPEW